MLGIVRKIPRNAAVDAVDAESVAVPFIYALLSSKQEIQYTSVLRAIVTVAREYNIENCRPEIIMTDFELAIINASRAVFPSASVSCCFFHLGQSIYRRIQNEGLQQAYNDAMNRNIKIYARMLLALAFVPVTYVQATFRMLRDAAETPVELEPVFEYFSVTYVNGAPRRGRRAALPPRFPVTLWNQYEATRDGQHRTNNVSEGWHNRFRLLVGKHHPDLYTLLLEFKKEQGEVEGTVADLSLGKSVKAAPKKNWITHQNRIRNITLNYDNYRRDGEVLLYLKALSNNIIL